MIEADQHTSSNTQELGCVLQWGGYTLVACLLAITAAANAIEQCQRASEIVTATNLASRASESHIILSSACEDMLQQEPSASKYISGFRYYAQGGPLDIMR